MNIKELKEMIKDLPDNMPLAKPGHSDGDAFCSYVTIEVMKLVSQPSSWRGNLDFSEDGVEHLVIQ